MKKFAQYLDEANRSAGIQTAIKALRPFKNVYITDLYYDEPLPAVMKAIETLFKADKWEFNDDTFEEEYAHMKVGAWLIKYGTEKSE
jgi:hypothetical protein